MSRKPKVNELGKKTTKKIRKPKETDAMQYLRNLRGGVVEIPTQEEILTQRQEKASNARAAIVDPIANAANARDAIDYNDPNMMAVLQANMAKARDAVRANAANARASIDHKAPNVIATRKANMAIARSQKVIPFINNSDLPDGTKQLFKDLKYSKEDVKLAIDLHNYSTNQQSQNQTSSIKSASPVRSPAKSASPVRSPSPYLDDF
jgi:hypothetical protein